jgi:hypothetical protein
VVLIVLIVAVIAIAIIGLVVMALRSVGQSGGQASSGSGRRGTSPRRSMPPVRDFHVRGETASVYFGVPLGDAEAGAHLTELLAANAVEVVRDKVDSGLPLDGVNHIAVFALRGDLPELLTTVDLPSGGELPDEAPILSRDPKTHDPIGAVQAVAADVSVAKPSGASDALEPVVDLVELSGPTEAHMRSLGIDTSSMSLVDFAVGLLRVSGYQVDPGPSGFSLPSVGGGKVFRASRGADTAILAIVEHADGEYPELDERVLAEFSVAVAQASPKRAILVTDKFGPYAMYERERRDKRLVLITRERLQAFADSFELG